MRVVIDANALSVVFNEENKRHNEFRPVLDYIRRRDRRGMFTYGGTKYIEELKKVESLLKIISELHRIRQALKLPCAEVDNKTKGLEREIARGFNDHHIIAIVIVGNCSIICSEDKSAYPFFKDRRYYHNRPVPRIYSKRKNADLLR